MKLNEDTKKNFVISLWFLVMSAVIWISNIIFYRSLSFNNFFGSVMLLVLTTYVSDKPLRLSKCPWNEATVLFWVRILERCLYIIFYYFVINLIFYIGINFFETKTGRNFSILGFTVCVILLMRPFNQLMSAVDSLLSYSKINSSDQNRVEDFSMTKVILSKPTVPFWLKTFATAIIILLIGWYLVDYVRSGMEILRNLGNAKTSLVITRLDAIEFMIKIIAIILAISALYIALANYNRKSGVNLVGNYSVNTFTNDNPLKITSKLDSNMFNDEANVSNIFIKNLKDKSELIFSIHLQLDNRYCLCLKDFGRNPITIKPFECQNFVGEEFGFYSVDGELFSINEFFSSEDVCKRNNLIIVTPEGQCVISNHSNSDLSPLKFIAKVFKKKVMPKIIKPHYYLIDGVCFYDKIYSRIIIESGLNIEVIDVYKSNNITNDRSSNPTKDTKFATLPVLKNIKQDDFVNNYINNKSNDFSGEGFKVGLKGYIEAESRKYSITIRDELDMHRIVIKAKLEQLKVQSSR